ncbi:hypothetical protein H310_02225 [Aphanomyces invadans]|uniref:Uncharacterized protein n=1 Tax=Aphanomyces invadans TaxID=157072 RepID=A0A024UMW5_9STRA|nr:hypothetical protein H310_02225 [Aphanomyces invadans]ETW07796.1 hypothetical protein H310_02225 [Aphanomyces invadans]|eukprot:XP_008863889.1 hypothetical protein H310_02225 [Aphanomyces invadans]
MYSSSLCDVYSWMHAGMGKTAKMDASNGNRLDSRCRIAWKTSAGTRKSFPHTGIRGICCLVVSSLVFKYTRDREMARAPSPQHARVHQIIVVLKVASTPWFRTIVFEHHVNGGRTYMQGYKHAPCRAVTSVTKGVIQLSDIRLD